MKNLKTFSHNKSLMFYNIPVGNIWFTEILTYTEFSRNSSYCSCNEGIVIETGNDHKTSQK